MSTLSDSFNRTGLSRFLNKPLGRLFRICAGIAFLVVGYVFSEHWLGVASMVWGIFPFSAGLFDICYVSAVLGGPISGKKIREMHKVG